MIRFPYNLIHSHPNSNSNNDGEEAVGEEGEEEKFHIEDMKNKLNLALETVLKELELKSKELKLNSFTTRIRISKRLEESLTDSSLSDLSSSSDEEENFKHQPQNKLKSRSKPLNSSMQSSKNLIPYLPSGRDKKVVAKITALASKVYFLLLLHFPLVQVLIRLTISLSLHY